MFDNIKTTFYMA